MALKAKQILDNVSACMDELEKAKVLGSKWDPYRMDYKGWSGNDKVFKINAVCEELSIFDWWNDHLSMSQLKQMKSFLEFAIANGYNGYACFKVGAKYCANGMWAFEKESPNGFSPRSGKAIYRSFVSGPVSWAIADGDQNWSDQMSFKELKKVMKEGYDD